MKKLECSVDRIERLNDRYKEQCDTEQREKKNIRILSERRIISWQNR